MPGIEVFAAVWMILAAVGGFIVYQRIRRSGFGSAKMLALAYVFLLILTARIGVNLLGSMEGMEELSVPERILDSFVHSFQSFSMDENYTGYTNAGKEMFEAAGHPVWAVIYGALISLLNVCAPLMGGAVLLEILTGIFPRLKLSFLPWRRKFVFSELNEAAVTLAEDLYREENYRKILYWDTIRLRPLIVFTDAYPDQESEAKSELFGRAKALRAVCLKEDLLHLDLSRSKSVYYFLLDDSERNNVAALAELMDGNRKSGNVWPAGEENEEFRTKVFVFCQSELSVSMINNICAASPYKDALLVRPIRDYANMAVNLMYEVPLFLPLLRGERTSARAGMKPAVPLSDAGTSPETEPGAGIAAARRTERFGAFLTERDKEGRIGGILPERELHVTILGSGAIAEEIFKAVYWCGQIAGIQLYIHVLSQASADMKSRLQVRCPELFASCRVVEEDGKTAGDERRGGNAAGSAVPQENRLLKIYPHTDSSLENPPYAVVDGFDLGINAEYLAAYPERILKKTDYYVVALGEDERNIFVAMMLKQEMAKRALESDSVRNPVIAPVVFSGKLAESVVQNTPGPREPYLIPFGMMDRRFSCRNVFMADVTADALRGELIYNKKSHAKRQKDEYSYWANIVRAVHAPYKLFGMGCVTGVEPGEPASKRFIGTWKDIAPDEPAFTWMEHRRWDAYMRTQGFCLPTKKQHDRYFTETGAHKDLTRKLHNCLVESGLRGKSMPEAVDPGLFGEGASPEMLAGALSEYDALDVVSIEAYHMECERKGSEETAGGRQEAEYKQWDEYCNDAASQRMMMAFGDTTVMQEG